MKEDKVLLTIITVNKNSGNKFKETKCSIESFIDSYKNVSWLVIDAVSEDQSGFEINNMENSKKIKIIKEEDNGIYDAMNKGLFLAKSKYVLFLNSGDTINNKYMAKALNECTKINGSLICGYKIKDQINIYKKAIAIPIHFIERIANLSLPSSHNSIIYELEILRDCPFSLEYACASDYNQFLSIKRKKHRFYSRSDLIISNIDNQGYIYNRKLISYKEAMKINMRHFNIIGYIYWYLRVFLYKLGLN